MNLGHSIFCELNDNPEVEIKILRFHLIPKEYLSTRNPIVNVVKAVCGKEHFFVGGGNIQLVCPLWKSVWRVL